MQSCEKSHLIIEGEYQTIDIRIAPIERRLGDRRKRAALTNTAFSIDTRSGDRRKARIHIKI